MTATVRRWLCRTFHHNASYIEWQDDTSVPVLVHLYVRCSVCQLQSSGIALGPTPNYKPAVAYRPFWWMRSKSIKKVYAKARKVKQPAPAIQRPAVIFSMGERRAK